VECGVQNPLPLLHACVRHDDRLHDLSVGRRLRNPSPAESPNANIARCIVVKECGHGVVGCDDSCTAHFKLNWLA
jgi:hypothetical protein